MRDSAFNSLAWATAVDVLPDGREVARRQGYWVIRSPANPLHYWGNFLVFDEPPERGDRERWEAIFLEEFAPEPPPHRVYAWDRPDGAEGEAASEFAEAGFELEHTVALLAAPLQLRAHPRADRSLEFRALEPPPGSDEPLWSGVLDLWLANNAEEGINPEADYRPFAQARIAELRGMFGAGDRGGWFALLDGGRVVGSLGIVVTGGRARYQQVDTHPAHRGRGIASRLVVEAAAAVRDRHPEIERFVIVADRDYHALGIYESLGFRRAEQLTSALRRPPVSAASS